MKKHIWIVPADTEVYDWSKTNFGQMYKFILKDSYDPPSTAYPDSVFIACDYRCSIEVCLDKFLYVLQFSDLPVFVARPILLKGLNNSGCGYILSRLERPCTRKRTLSPSYFLEFSGFTKDNGYPSPKIATIIGLQREIISSKGKLCRVSDLKKYAHRCASWLSTRFTQTAGLGPKAFINKIRLCNCLWELAIGTSPIKQIAIDYGYRPAAFSNEFFRHFDIWPTKIRRN